MILNGSYMFQCKQYSTWYCAASDIEFDIRTTAIFHPVLHPSFRACSSRTRPSSSPQAPAADEQMCDYTMLMACTQTRAASEHDIGLADFDALRARSGDETVN